MTDLNAISPWKNISAVCYFLGTQCHSDFQCHIPYLNQICSDTIDGPELESLFSNKNRIEFTTQRPHTIDVVQYLFRLIVDRIVQLMSPHAKNPHRIRGLLQHCAIGYTNPTTGSRHQFRSVDHLRELFQVTCRQICNRSLLNLAADAFVLMTNTVLVFLTIFMSSDSVLSYSL